jgi:predicted hotdog family 3-hydroxylacyl-ACP dehydratase
VKLPEASALVPHRGDALLLDAIDEAGGDGLVASLVVRGQSPFSSDDGALPAWTGPEIMAQAISAFATLRKGPPYLPRPGLLLGVRRFRSALAEFPRGARITVSVRESTRDDAGSAVFDSFISVDGAPVAEGMLTVFEPEDVFAVLAEQLA